jgi:hypothetical protein
VAGPEPEADGDLDLSARRWGLLRDVLNFQAKMLLEGIRDLLLVPVSLIAGLAGLLLLGDRPERLFRGVLRLTHRFDVWLNLLGPMRRRDDSPPSGGIDRYFESIEKLIVDQHDRGGMTHTARNKIDGWLDRLQETTAGRGGSPRDE